jgi:hypothetical protein
MSWRSFEVFLCREDSRTVRKNTGQKKLPVCEDCRHWTTVWTRREGCVHQPPAICKWLCLSVRPIQHPASSHSSGLHLHTFPLAEPVAFGRTWDLLTEGATQCHSYVKPTQILRLLRTQVGSETLKIQDFSLWEFCVPNLKVTPGAELA